MHTKKSISMLVGVLIIKALVFISAFKSVQLQGLGTQAFEIEEIFASIASLDLALLIDPVFKNGLESSLNTTAKCREIYITIKNQNRNYKFLQKNAFRSIPFSDQLMTFSFIKI
ncbi:hypothetical protein BpHYR1_012596 [Brachionus plicatilis]|uniref:Uncharacterized protein n=1 Tax=Brachionus plicatilis TaxID=10195 RepID=A0A3M7T2B2_BRAPC|nr:hypothetical protein BpHYR1_012596 [Brachionus plicatilis]